METRAVGTEHRGASLQRLALAVRLTVALNLDPALGQRFVLDVHSPKAPPSEVDAVSVEVVVVHRRSSRRHSIRCWEDRLALVQLGVSIGPHKRIPSFLL